MAVLVGKVTEEEKREIEILYEKKTALKNLLKIKLKRNDKEKIADELKNIEQLMEQWGKEKSEKYAWKSKPNGKWQILFSTCEILLE